MNTMKSFLPVAGLIFGSLLAACSPPLPPTQAGGDQPLPPSGAHHEYKVKFPDPGHGVARYVRITIGEDLAKDCGLGRAHFEFDSSEPLPQDQIMMKSLAACLDQLELRDAPVLLVGSADRRGSAAYNAALGLRRADRMKELLVGDGVAADRIRTRSTGAGDAIGDDGMVSFGYDRRVDTVVAVVHAPR
jgi:outer membrane protein OmpA-like peptidoglycan-associated protein